MDEAGEALAIDLRHRQERSLGAALCGRMDDAVETAETLDAFSRSASVMSAVIGRIGSAGF